MDAITYLKEKGRMTDNCRILCPLCPMGEEHNEHNVNCMTFESDYPEEAISILEAWSKANPPMTKKKKFFEMCPNAPKHSNGYPYTAPYYVGLCKGKNDCQSCEHYCLSDKACWDLPLDE